MQWANLRHRLQAGRWVPRSRIAWAALLSLLGYAAAHVAGAGGLRFVFGFLFVVLSFVVALRLLVRWRRKMLWRLRNRLLVTYLFIAIIPILLIVAMVGLTGYLLYGQLAGYLIVEDFATRAWELGAIGESLANELAERAGPGSPSRVISRKILERGLVQLRARFDNPVLALVAGGEVAVVPAGTAPVLCATLPSWVGESFRDVVAYQNRLFLHTAVQVPGWRGARLCLTVPVNQSLLAQVGSGIGPFSLDLYDLLPEGSPVSSRRAPLVIGDQTYVSGARFEFLSASLPPPQYWIDPTFRGVSKFNVVRWTADSPQRQELPVFVYITTRASLLNQRIFAPLGEVAQVLLTLLVVAAVVFLLLQVVSVVTGVRLSRGITLAVHDLYLATQRVQAGDFSVRIPRRSDDQLGRLGDSFNQMAASIERLIEESKQRQRLENELEIARQVQEQLFPRSSPVLKTLDVLGYCRPARTVSGDYYDYGMSQRFRLLLTIGDISGKGISAALLMATIQSILRSQVYASRLMGQMEQLSVAELVTRVNRQLCATTSQEKYSTLFVGMYDDATRRLTYTNAGHIPPILLRHGRVEKLTAGGAVVGLFAHLKYEEATVQLQPGDWVVAFTDGLTEVENSYEEEYGIPRLTEFIRRRVDGLTPSALVDAVLSELEQWSPGAEQSDDRTLLIARVR